MASTMLNDVRLRVFILLVNGLLVGLVAPDRRIS